MDCLAFNPDKIHLTKSASLPFSGYPIAACNGSVWSMNNCFYYSREEDFDQFFQGERACAVCSLIYLGSKVI